MTGITDVNTHFPIFFALGPEENNEFMDWAISRLRALALQHRIPLPLGYITDFSHAERNALMKHFPQSQSQLCLWHIMKNVVKYIKDHWKGPKNAALEGLNPGTTPIADHVVDEKSSHPEGDDYQFDRKDFTYSPTGILAMWKAIAWTRSTTICEGLWEELKELFGDRQISKYATFPLLLLYC